MSTVKPSEDQLEKMKRRNAALELQIERVRIFEDNKDSEFWQTIKSMCQTKLDYLEDDIDNYEKILYTECDKVGKLVSLLEGRKQLKFFRDLVDNFVANKKNFEKSLFEGKQSVRNYEKELASV